MRKVLVIIPTYNEAKNIKQVIDAVEQAALQMRSYDFSILVVDDDSPDGTAKHVKALQKQYDNIGLLTGQKSGLGRAYIRGFEHALKQEGFNVLIMMDGDLSHNPADIPALLKALNTGADYVIGSRYVTGGVISGNWPFTRKINSRVANFVARKLVGTTDTVTDLTGGFKAIRREALEQINLSGLNVSGYIFQVSLLHAFLLKGFRVQEVPITFANRSQGTSKLRMRDIIEFLYCAYKLNPNAPIQRIVRFGFVGACGTIVNLAILTLLIKLVHVNVFLSVAIAIEGSIIFNFLLNHFYTFRGYGSYTVRSQRESLHALLLKMGKFNVGALGGAVISFTTFTLLFKLLHINYFLADIIAIGVAMSWNYYMSTRFVWKAIDGGVNLSPSPYTEHTV
jgi:dolichol-phosphate mannosyltransferase